MTNAPTTGLVQAESVLRDGPAASTAEADMSAPDARESELVALGQKYLLGNYRQAPVILQRGVGCEVFDTTGKRYLDFSAGIAVSSLGHAHPRLAAEIAAQAGRLIHMSNYFYNEQNVLLAKELCQTLGFDRAFFCNSGTEANEALLKLARRYFWSLGQPERVRIIAFDHAFHGRTFGALSLTGTPKYKEGFGPGVEGVTHVPYGDIAAVRAAMGPDVAAIIVEPIQGEGGVISPPSGFLKELRRVTEEAGALLLIDEVQTGMGRTGRWLGIEHEGVKPDAVSLAKGLAGGVPIGAVVLREGLNAALPPGTHGTTFGGNALASAAARTVLAVLREDNLVEGARVRGEYLGRRLTGLVTKHPKVCSCERGVGLLRGLVLASGLESRDLLAPIREAGVLVTSGGTDVLRFTPPLVVREGEIDEAVERISSVLSKMEQGVAG